MDYIDTVSVNIFIQFTWYTPETLFNSHDTPLKLYSIHMIHPWNFKINCISRELYILSGENVKQKNILTFCIDFCDTQCRLMYRSAMNVKINSVNKECSDYCSHNNVLYEQRTRCQCSVNTFWHKSMAGGVFLQYRNPVASLSIYSETTCVWTDSFYNLSRILL